MTHAERGLIHERPVPMDEGIVRLGRTCREAGGLENLRPGDFTERADFGLGRCSVLQSSGYQCPHYAEPSEIGNPFSGLLSIPWQIPMCLTHQVQLDTEWKLAYWDLQVAAEIRTREAVETEHREHTEGLQVIQQVAKKRAHRLGLYESGECTYLVKRQGWVKIGRTTNLKARLVSLTNGGCAMPVGMLHWEPLYLHAVLPGNSESELHERWSKVRVKGTEWFVPDTEMTRWLREVKDNHHEG